jgi:hypothetical protein
MGSEWGYHGVSGDIMGYYMNIYKYINIKIRERESRESQIDR